MKQINNLKIQSKRAASRAFSGFVFIEECLSKIYKSSTDGAFSRSVYILFSYHIELLIKSIILNYFSDQQKPIPKIEIHNLDELAKKVPAEELYSFGIKSIIKKYDDTFIFYEMICTDQYGGCVITVCDFVDVRYDYVRDNLRKINFEEVNKFKEDVLILLNITKKLL